MQRIRIVSRHFSSKFQLQLVANAVVSACLRESAASQRTRALSNVEGVHAVQRVSARLRKRFPRGSRAFGYLREVHSQSVFKAMEMHKPQLVQRLQALFAFYDIDFASTTLPK